MKKYNLIKFKRLIAHKYTIFNMIMAFTFSTQALAASSTSTFNEADPQAEMLAAEERFRQAEKAFVAAENAEARAALTGTANPASPIQRDSGYTAPATSALQPRSPAVQGQPKADRPTSSSPIKPENKPSERPDTQMGTGPAFMGSPQTGYSAIWSDPATGDSNISVIAPTDPVQTTPAYPMVIEPVIGGGNWSGSSDTWSSNSNWGNHWNGYQPPPFSPGYFPPQGGMNNHRPPFNPNYRPLRPNNPSIWNPGQVPNPGFPNPDMGMQPPFPDTQPPLGWNAPSGNPPFGNPHNPAIRPPLPGMPGSPPSPGWTQTPGFPSGNPHNPAIRPPLPGMPGSPPTSGFQPGAYPPGFIPGIPRGGMPTNMRPLPMAPGGMSPPPGRGF